MTLDDERRFRQAASAALVAVLMVVVAGAVVRATGSGMGCPDWPRCFGLWAPPTDVTQLPADYQTRYQVAGKPIEPFNVYKTWTEYGNRLVGAISGMFVFAMMLMAWPLRRTYALPLSVATFFLMAFQGWMGAKVVGANLAPYMITIHMLLALVILFMLIIAADFGRKEAEGGQKTGLLFGLSAGLLVLVLAQTALGTQVREAVDEIAVRRAYLNREVWVDDLGLTFYVHRSFSILIVLLLAAQYYLAKRHEPDVLRLLTVGLTLVGVEVAAGMTLAYLGMPIFAQPVHLVIGTLVVLAQFSVVLRWGKQYLHLRGRAAQANFDLKGMTS